MRLTAPQNSPLAPGTGTVARLLFSVPATPPGDSTVIKIENYDDKVLAFVSAFATYSPARVNGIVYKQCCFNQRGNIDNDGNDELTISDLLYFVDFFFDEPSGPEPACTLEADVNADSTVDISDLLYMVDYFFADPSGDAPKNCPE